MLARRNLADTQNRGSLDATDFCIAMYFTEATTSGQLASIPDSLPPNLYDWASGKFDAATSHSTGSSVQPSFSPSLFSTGPVQFQYTGELQTQLTDRGAALSILPRPAAGPEPSAFSQSNPFRKSPTLRWDVAPAEKTDCDRWFDDLDTAKKGYIDGGVAIPFMTQSNLSEEVLGHIWWVSVATISAEWI